MKATKVEVRLSVNLREGLENSSGYKLRLLPMMPTLMSTVTVTLSITQFSSSVRRSVAS